MFRFLPQVLQITLLYALKISLDLPRHSTVSKMTNHSEEQENSRLSRSKAGVCLLIAALGYILIVTSLLLFIFTIFELFTKNLNSAISKGTSATVMMIFGVTLVLLVRVQLKKGSKFSAVQVEISAISAPRRQPFVGASSIDLPDYFTAVQDLNEVYSSVDAAFDTDDAPPPSYEEALKMASRTSQENKSHSFSLSGEG